MSLFKVFNIAGSAMSAQSVRLNVISSNLANAESASSSINQTYRARQPIFAAVMDSIENDMEQASVCVRVLGMANLFAWVLAMPSICYRMHQAALHSSCFIVFRSNPPWMATPLILNVSMLNLCEMLFNIRRVFHFSAGVFVRY